MPRIHCPTALSSGLSLELPAAAARHVQVLRMQPGHTLTLFDGRGGEFDAQVTHMGRNEVRVTVGEHRAIEREAQRPVHLVVGMPANERMDWLVEKATELGVERITPVMTERSVLRLHGERAEKKQAHWQAIAISACEQCGRNRLPTIALPLRLSDWLVAQPCDIADNTSAADTPLHAVLSLHASTQPWSDLLGRAAPISMADPQGNALPSGSAELTSSTRPVVLLSGPEGGLSDAEDAAARQAGYMAVHVGPRVLRAETAALAALAYVSLHDAG